MRVSASIEYVRRWETARCFPLPPPFSPESQPDPTRERQQHFRRFPESEIAAPAPPIRSQFLYRRFHADTLCPSRDLPDSLLQRLFSSSGAFNPHNTPVRCGLVHRAVASACGPEALRHPAVESQRFYFFPHQSIQLLPALIAIFNPATHTLTCHNPIGSHKRGQKRT
jgi:hypothetical protein